MEDRKAITDSGYLCPDEPIPEAEKSPLLLLQETCRNIGKDLPARRERRTPYTKPRRQSPKVEVAAKEPPTPIAIQHTAPDFAQQMKAHYDMVFQKIYHSELERIKLNSPPRVPPTSLSSSQLTHPLLSSGFINPALFNTPTSSSLSANPLFGLKASGFDSIAMNTSPSSLDIFKLSSLLYPKLSGLSPPTLTSPPHNLGSRSDLSAASFSQWESQHECHWVTPTGYCGRQFGSYNELMSHLHSHVSGADSTPSDKLCRSQIKTHTNNPVREGLRFRPYNLLTRQPPAFFGY